jgi:hemoglobin
MDTVPQFQGIRVMHPADLSTSRDKLYMFLSGWMGGPDLFVEKFGHPRLRGRHMPFAIGVAERDQWVACMVLAMDDVGVEKELSKKLLENFFHTADFMRNKEG